MKMIEFGTVVTMFKTFGLCKLGHIIQFDQFLLIAQSCNFHEMLKYVKIKKNAWVRNNNFAQILWVYSNNIVCI